MGAKAMLVKRLEILNPKLEDEFHRFKSQSPLIDLYLMLKKEGWRYAPNGMLFLKNKNLLSLEEVEWIKKHFSKHYHLEQSSQEVVTDFYSNAIQGLYASVAHVLKEDFVERILGGDLSLSKQKRQFGVDLLDSFYYPNALESRDLSPQKALELLNQDVGDQSFWTGSLILFSELEEKPKKMGSRELRDWLETQSFYQSLDFDRKEILRRALSGFKLNVVCCMTDPGCVQCPHNRRFIKKDSSD